MSHELIHNDLFRCSMLVTLLLIFKFWLTNVMAGGAKAKAGARAPEDTFQNAAPTPEDVAALDRANRIVSNDIENIPVGLIMIWASLLCILTDPQFPFRDMGTELDDKYHWNAVKAHMAFTIIFCIARYAHTIVYKLALPTVIRTICWLVGVLAMFAVGITGVVIAFRQQHA